MSRGDLGVTIDRSRADEFGPLIDAFNTMVGGLREKVLVEENFGRHVGQAVARAIMARPAGLGGAEEAGEAHRMEFTAIGDAVNVAARVEGLAAVLGERLLVTAATRAALKSPPPLEALAPQAVKGQPDPIVVFRLAVPTRATMRA